MSWGQKAKAVGKILLSGALGATAGFASGGLSCIGTVISTSASHAQLAGKMSWTTATAIRVASLVTFTGLGIGNVSFGGASSAFDGPAIDRVLGSAELSRVQGAETGLGTITDAAAEFGEGVEAHGSNASIKAALKADWEKSILSKGARKAGRGFKKIGRGIAKGAKKLAAKVRRKKP
jgi:hypothetical protein